MVRTPPEQKAKIICYGIPEGTTEQDLIEGINRVLEIVTQNTSKLMLKFTDNNNRTPPERTILLLKREAIQSSGTGSCHIIPRPAEPVHIAKPFMRAKTMLQMPADRDTQAYSKNDNKAVKMGILNDTRICKRKQTVHQLPKPAVTKPVKAQYHMHGSLCLSSNVTLIENTKPTKRFNKTSKSNNTQQKTSPLLEECLSNPSELGGGERFVQARPRESCNVDVTSENAQWITAFEESF
ncbi:hypothetical protein CDAR_8071 [Caerostris darwini]|uniref:Uncharacterized protein n=1 Tax=Caerostris darwini TaxID=1538125 RepID=A0AAV4Q9C4_9ARAC|nr:hypothetical protein CDAR_8071 [Caerostris darwini]